MMGAGGGVVPHGYVATQTPSTVRKSYHYRNHARPLPYPAVVATLCGGTQEVAGFRASWVSSPAWLRLAHTVLTHLVMTTTTEGRTMATSGLIGVTEVQS